MAPANASNSAASTRIAQERIKRDWGQKELAERSGVSQGTVKNLEQRRVANPSLLDYLAIAEALGVSIDELIEPEWRNAPDLVERDETGLPQGPNPPAL